MSNYSLCQTHFKADYNAAGQILEFASAEVTNLNGGPNLFTYKQHLDRCSAATWSTYPHLCFQGLAPGRNSDELVFQILRLLWQVLKQQVSLLSLLLPLLQLGLQWCYHLKHTIMWNTQTTSAWLYSKGLLHTECECWGHSLLLSQKLSVPHSIC